MPYINKAIFLCRPNSYRVAEKHAIAKYTEEKRNFGNEGELSLIVDNFFLSSILVPSPTAFSKWR